MRFGTRRVAINALALVAISGAITLVPPISAQTRDRGAGADMFRPFGAGSEIGVSVRELTNDEVSGARLDSPGGVYVQSVREGSPAARAGLRAGDIIVAVDAERVRGVRQFSRFVLESPAGRSVRAEIVRDGSRQVLSVTPEASARFAVPVPELREELERMLRTLPPNVDLELPRAPRAAQARLGITVTPLTDQLAMYFGVKEGVLVSAVETGSPAANAGLKAGDVITAIDGRTVRTQADVLAAVRRVEAGVALDVRLVREKKEVAVKVEVPDTQPRGVRRIPI